MELVSEIMTFTKKMFDPLQPNAELIDIADIAHALSMLCRANGHFKSFYSVAQHSINCMQEAKSRGYSERVQLACLLHDASEAYLSDVTRPVKAEMPRYKEIEAPLQELIWNKWLVQPLTQEEQKQVFDIDDAILAHEFLNLMDAKIVGEIPEILSNPVFAFVGFESCKQRFLRLFRQLTTGEKEYFAVGIDWMKPYWLAAELRGTEISIRKLSDIAEINRYYLSADAVLIDIPVGIPENMAENAARPDCEARNFLPPERKSTIFPVPCRQAIYCENYGAASAENQQVLGKKLPSQSFAFSKMIRQVDDFLSKEMCWQNRLMESRPEVAFQMLNGGNGLQYSKHTEAGIAERITILRSNGVDPVPLFAEFTPKQYEDVLDALCLAVSAKLGCEHEFQTMPKNPVADSRGLKMQMVFGNTNG